MTIPCALVSRIRSGGRVQKGQGVVIQNSLAVSISGLFFYNMSMVVGYGIRNFSGNK